MPLPPAPTPIGTDVSLGRFRKGTVVRRFRDREDRTLYAVAEQNCSNVLHYLWDDELRKL